MKLYYAFAVLAFPFELAATTLYAIDDSSNVLLTIDRSTFAIAVVGDTGIATGDFGDLAYDSNHSVMYWSAGRGNGNIYTLNLMTGSATLLGATGLSDLFALAYDTGNNTLYGASDTDKNLYSINTTTGAATLVGATGIFDFFGGLAYRPDNNTLYLTGAGSGKLYAVNVSTGAATLFSAGAGVIDDDGITWDPLLGVFWVDEYAGGKVDQYDVAFASRSLETTSVYNLDGIAFVGDAAVPEPGTLGLTLAAAVFVRLAVQRRGL